MTLKWIVNLWLVGVPWGFALLALFGWNMYVNIFWNKWWGEGNFFLMGNTLYIIAQSIVSIPLMFEIPLVLRFMKPFRVISFFSAISYNIMFLGSVADFFYITKAEDKNDFEDEGQFEGDALMALFIFYNLVENFPIIIINSGIILKEVMLPFFQLVGNTKAPNQKDRIQLSLIDLEDAFFFFTNLVNPAWISKKIFILFFGWNPADMVIENKHDEQHYYAGKAYNGIKGYI